MAYAQSITHFRITDHARTEMIRRQIEEEQVEQVLAAPERVEIIREGRKSINLAFNQACRSKHIYYGFSLTLTERRLKL